MEDSAALEETRTSFWILQVNYQRPRSDESRAQQRNQCGAVLQDAGEKVKIEVVTFGPGLHMLREDTSPVKASHRGDGLSTPEVSFKACGNTPEKMQKAENKDIPIVRQAEVVKSASCA